MDHRFASRFQLTRTGILASSTVQGVHAAAGLSGMAADDRKNPLRGAQTRAFIRAGAREAARVVVLEEARGPNETKANAS